MLGKHKHVPLAFAAMAMLVGTTSLVVPVQDARAAWFRPLLHKVNANTRADGLDGKVIVVDAGHGGRDSGARGVGGIEEKDITLAVAHRLARYLQQGGAIVVMTRTADTDLATERDRAMKQRHLGDLRGRLAVVRRQRVDAFVSIHCNSAPSPDWRGAQVLYLRSNPHAKQLASAMQEAFRAELLPTNRDVQANRTLFLLKRIEGPTVLAEIGFVSNPEEARALTTPAYQERVAFAMYEALVRYFSDPAAQQIGEPDAAHGPEPGA
ncbi:N-acetylmuramoyl-L-alanine amidase [Alicyclobacillus vulcanalis]|uniref:N-acetylmuramoyl-L-alanine amidase n=1 Tax=Alicyclobacillus vulcanalis TaxID=252246 RepID=A0A1N7LBG4_9BACL|nr:N-acetylmuramoyl-L-alanine amidase [Alicyclobacillus vulcanalis]SIS71121.1 N-acetylmuramoyl-L-alanine amidase [Alicyclobacillus vulcanalis]